MQDANNGLNIVIMDACRNNPFARQWRRFRSAPAPQGLAVVQAVRGTLIAYATAPGGVAADGRGRNGVYTKHLLQQMTVPSVGLERMFRQVRVGVLKETRRKQTPWESSSLTGEFSFVPVVSPPPTTISPPAASPSPDPEAEMWALVKGTSQASELRVFLQAYPKGRFAPTARLLLARMQPVTPRLTEKQAKEQQKLQDIRNFVEHNFPPSRWKNKTAREQWAAVRARSRNTSGANVIRDEAWLANLVYLSYRYPFDPDWIADPPGWVNKSDILENATYERISRLAAGGKLLDKPPEQFWDAVVPR